MHGEKYILYFVVTPRNFIIAKLSIRKPGSSSDIISTDEDPGLRIESFAIIKLRGVTTKYKICGVYVVTPRLHETGTKSIRDDLVSDDVYMRPG